MLHVFIMLVGKRKELVIVSAQLAGVMDATDATVIVLATMAFPVLTPHARVAAVNGINTAIIAIVSIVEKIQSTAGARRLHQMLLQIFYHALRLDLRMGQAVKVVSVLIHCVFNVIKAHVHASTEKIRSTLLWLGRTSKFYTTYVT